MIKLFYSFSSIETEFIFHLTGDGWIEPPDLDKDGLYDNLVWCRWFIRAPINHAIELEIHFMQIEGNYPSCNRDSLAVSIFLCLHISFHFHL